VSLRCVIVDDNPAFLEAARGLFEQEGVQVVAVASTWEETIRRTSTLRPDVTLVDIDLGGSSGFAVVERLAVDDAAHAGRLILISAHEEDGFAELIEASPALGFVSKSALSRAAIEQLLASAPPSGPLPWR
jgi:DNA-binding NarL/FixJ family response regulator